MWSENKRVRWQRTRRSIAIGGALAMVAVGAGCGDDDGEEPNPRPDAGGGSVEMASLRVVHAAPDAPPVDVYAEGGADPLIEDLAYGEASGYLEVAPGDYVFEVRAAGAAPTSDPVFTTGTLALTANARVTAVAAGLLETDEDDSAFRIVPLIEEFQAPAAEEAVVRVVHAAATAPTVALDVGNDGSAELEGLERFNATAAGGVALPAGQALQIGVLAGDPLAPVTAFTTPALPAGAEVFLIATGSLNERPGADAAFQLLAVTGDGALGFIDQNPAVYALHASPDAPPVNICAGDQALAENLAYGSLSAAIRVPPGSYGLDFYAYAAGQEPCAGTPAQGATPIDTPALEAGQEYLVIAAGELAPEAGDKPFQLIAVTPSFDSAAGESGVAVAHASGDAPTPVDVGLITGGVIATPPVFDGVAFGTLSPSVSLAPMTYLLGVGAAGSAPLASFSVELGANLEVVAVAIGEVTRETPADEQPFALALIDTRTWQVAGILEPQP